MVTLDQVHASNAEISKSLPAELVGVFVGATSGIGEAGLKEFVSQAKQPKCYLVGRSEQAATRIIDECKTLNPDARVIFMRADVSLVKEVDKLCEDIKSKENTINVLFLSAGSVEFDRRKTPEGLHKLMALVFYTRLRITQHLLPLLERATGLARVINIAGGTKEATFYPDDIQALNVPLYAIRGHLATLITLGLEALAARSPSVSFIQVFPGAVKTPLFDRIEGIIGVVMRFWIYLAGSWILVPIQESGERNVFLATSAAFPAADRGKDGVELVEGVNVAKGTNGTAGSGIYSVDYDGTEASESIVDLLAKYREEGMVEEVWAHAQAEFERIVGQTA